MKTCPNCGELIGENADECFKCHYNYVYRRVITAQEIKARREREEREKENEIKNIEIFEKEKELQIKRNPLYEYKIEIVNDLETGEIDSRRMQYIVEKYSSEGWRLHNVFTNELGKTSTLSGIAFLGVSVNATICQTIFIFERCIKA